MKKLNPLLLLFVTITLTSITKIKAASNEPTTTHQKSERIDAAIEKSQINGTLTYKELKAIAEEAKGSKLSFRDKIVLKLFGKKISKAISSYGDGSKSKMTAIFLCAFLGDFGVHRFYLGYTWQGIVQILTLGGLGIWALIDFIRLLSGSLQPKDGDFY